MAQITLRDYVQETEDAISSKRVDEALASCQYILAYFPESLEAQRLLGEVYLAQGRFEDARNAFDWVLTNDPENVIAYCSRAKVSELMSDYDTALDCYQQAYELSRGNSQIRQAFNDLSEKVGQPGFMFSRAGLARLYMRGSLLSQAIQEWDIVLSVTPDRLDARTGLLEAYWRQGLYDRVSQVAEQVLQDVPGCVKALLLLAHVTAPQDMLRSRDLMQRVSSLDPDLQMARDLFADAIASNVGDPFLKLLDRPAATLGEPDRAVPAPSTVGASAQVESPSGHGFGGSSVAAEQLSGWSGSENWQSESTLIKSRADKGEPSAPAAQVDAAALPSWMSDSALQNRSAGVRGSSPDAGARSNTGFAQTSSSDPTWHDSLSGLQTGRGSGAHWSGTSWDAPEQPATQDAGDQAEPWQLLQHALNNVSSDVVEKASDHGLRQDEQEEQLSQLNGSNWDLSAQPAEQAQPDDLDAQAPEPSWMQREQPSDNVAPPAWLNMLTRPEHEQLNTTSTPDQAVEPQEPIQPALPVSPFLEPASPQPALEPEPANSKANASAAPAPAPADSDEEELPEWARMIQGEEAGNDDDEDSFFGPAWLRSLGAMDESGAEPQGEQEAQPLNAAQTTSEVQPELQQPERESAWTQPDQNFTSPAAAGPVATPQESVQETTTAPEYTFGSSWTEWQALQMKQQEQAPEEATPWWQESQGQYDPFGSANRASKSETAPQYNPFAQQTPEEQPTTYSAQEPASSDSDLSHDWSSRFASAPSQANTWPDESLNQDQSDDYAAASPAAQGSPADESPWTKLSQQVSDNAIDYSWLEQIASQATANAYHSFEQPQEEQQPEASSQGEPEQHVITTLEELDQRLRSRGFIPHEPNSLSSIAQSEEPSEEAVPAAEPQVARPVQQEEPQADPTLFSAFAELSNYYTHSSAPAEEETPRQEEEPSWLTALGFGTVPAPSVPEIGYTEPEPAVAQWQPAEEPTVSNNSETRFAAAMPAEATPAVPQTPFFQQQHVEQQPVAPFSPDVVVPPTPVVPTPAFSQDFVAERRVPESVPTPAPVARVNPLLDSELETTMKRPAVRLQPMKQRAAGQEQHLSATHTKNRATDQAHQLTEDSASYRKRLVQGYQAQLIGDYDTAMQEYRVIIRSAPELLGDVVSNVRALLKLAPKYSAGYRVLGDAYMRQGEYLQAMEAYNKALTMAKKAKN